MKNRAHLERIMKSALECDSELSSLFHVPPISIDIVQLQYKDIDPVLLFRFIEKCFLFHLTRSHII